MRNEPPRSLPSSSALKPAAIAAADPPDDPPGVRARFHGLFVVPKRSLYDCESPANSGRFVFPTTMAPAARTRATASASSAGTYSASIEAPAVVRIPAVARQSL